jgi:methyl-accepting chemotaxis protein
MPNNPNQRHWKNFLIRKDVQLPIILTNLVFLSIVTAIIIAVVLSPLYIDMLHGENLWVQQVSGNLFLVLLRRISAAAVLILITAAVHQIIFSHRFCGPLVNFGQTFDQMAGGDFSRKVLLRKNDFLKREAAQVNAVIDRLNTDGGDLRAALERMAALTAQLQEQPLSPQVKDLITELQRAIDAGRNTVSAWVIESPDRSIRPDRHGSGNGLK